MRLSRYCLILLVFLVICGLPAVDYGLVYAITDTLYEDFDNYATNTSIDGVDKWLCTQGDPDDAITQAVTTMTGTGNALEPLAPRGCKG